MRGVCVVNCNSNTGLRNYCGSIAAYLTKQVHPRVLAHRRARDCWLIDPYTLLPQNATAASSSSSSSSSVVAVARVLLVGSSVDLHVLGELARAGKRLGAAAVLAAEGSLARVVAAAAVLAAEGALARVDPHVHGEVAGLGERLAAAAAEGPLVRPVSKMLAFGVERALWTGCTCPATFSRALLALGLWCGGG